MRLKARTVRSDFQNGVTHGGVAKLRDLKFAHLTTSDGLSHSNVKKILQDRRGFMWFASREGLDRYDGNPYIPPVVITSLKIFNKPVPIGPKSVLKRAVPYVQSLTLPSRDSVFSFEFAALSYENPRKNHYRYKLENFDRSWNDVGSNPGRDIPLNRAPRPGERKCWQSCNGVVITIGVST